MRNCDDVAARRDSGRVDRTRFALIKVFLASDLVALDALVDDDTELIPVLMEILVGALLKLVSVEELSRQVDQWLDERRTRLVG